MVTAYACFSELLPGYSKGYLSMYEASSHPVSAAKGKGSWWMEDRQGSRMTDDRVDNIKDRSDS